MTVKTCDAVTAPDNGFVNVTNFLLGAKLSFGCNEGFELVGDEELTCEAKKVDDNEESITWNGTVPTCSNATEFEYYPIIVGGVLYCPCSSKK